MRLAGRYLISPEDFWAVPGFTMDGHTLSRG